MAIYLTPYDTHMLDRYLDAMVSTARTSRDLRVVRSSLIELIEMVAGDDPDFRRHLKDAVIEIQDA